MKHRLKRLWCWFFGHTWIIHAYDHEDYCLCCGVTGAAVIATWVEEERSSASERKRIVKQRRWNEEGRYR